jgi:uncharacterized BrkB/YihY/UPF0761 family membrane protein
MDDKDCGVVTLKYPIPQNPSKPTIILNISGRMAVVLAVILIIGIGLAVLVNYATSAPAAAGVPSEDEIHKGLPDMVLIIIAIFPAAVYLLLYYPLPDGRRLIDWIKHIINFYKSSQTYYFRRVRRP